MSEKQVFVGREEELKQFKQILENLQGQAILVIGQSGMGKTFLVNKMAEIAQNHPDLKCGCIRYEVTPTDSVDSTMERMMDNAFDAAQVTEGSFAGTERRLEQWKALLNIINLGDLVLSLRRDPAKHTREQFLDRLNLISKKMQENGRAIFIIDPEKYMQKESDPSWAIVVEQLPEKIKFVFAQRSEDALVDSETFNQLKNVIRIPPKHLDVLDESAVDELIQLESSQIKYPISEIKKVISSYKGHPYAVGAALELLKAGTKLEELPKHNKPVDFAKAQWNKICEKGDDAIALFEAYTILEVGVPDDIAGYVSELNSTTLKRLQNDNYLKGLLREEGEGKRIYHSILADFILGQMNELEKKKCHKGAMKIYWGKLKKAKKEKIKPDELAATRLPEHVLETVGQEVFVDIFVNECFVPLHTLGALDTCISLSERALKMVKKNSDKEAALLGNLGIIYETRGELFKAEEAFNKVLEIGNKLSRPDIISPIYCNLGVIYKTGGELNKAEEMHKKALEINKKFGDQNGLAKNYCGLGLIYEARGELYKAEETYKKALEINKKLGNLAGIATDRGNLGNIYFKRKELDRAKEEYNKALEIAGKIGDREKMAFGYGSLGTIYYTCDDLKKAEEMYKKALEINEKIGALEGMSGCYCGLGVVYYKRKEFDKAEVMYKKALEIDERIGNLEGAARQYGNLGIIYKIYGDLKKMEEYWLKARDLYAKIGMPNELKNVQGWIDDAEKENRK